MQVLFFLNAAVLSWKILVKANNRIRTRYWHLLNIKGLGSGSGGKKKNLIGTSLTFLLEISLWQSTDEQLGVTFVLGYLT